MYIPLYAYYTTYFGIWPTIMLIGLYKIIDFTFELSSVYLSLSVIQSRSVAVTTIFVKYCMYTTGN